MRQTPQRVLVINTLRAIQEGLTARGAVLQELPDNASEVEVKALAVAESHRLQVLEQLEREQIARLQVIHRTSRFSSPRESSSKVAV